MYNKLILVYPSIVDGWGRGRKICLITIHFYTHIKKSNLNKFMDFLQQLHYFVQHIDYSRDTKDSGANETTKKVLRPKNRESNIFVSVFAILGFVSIIIIRWARISIVALLILFPFIKV